MFNSDFNSINLPATVDFVTRTDLLAHLNALKAVYDHCINLDTEGLYNYFLITEEEYLSNSLNRNPGSGSYAALVHKLHPIKYTVDLTSAFRGQSIRSRLVCCLCSLWLPLNDAFELHMKRSSVQCKSCSRTFTYENHRVIAFKALFIAEMNVIISRQIQPNYLSAQASLLDLNDYACTTYRSMGDWFREKLRNFSRTAYAAHRWRIYSAKSTIRTASKAIWVGFVDCVKRYSQCGLSSLSVDLVQGMYRQLDFTNKLCSNYAYWTHPAVLDAAIARYDMFLRIVPSAKGKMLVPTLDIDLAWHAHQQADDAYQRYTKAICGSVLNHDDDITGGDTSHGYTRAFMKWSQRYGEAISVAPCAGFCLSMSAQAMKHAAIGIM